MELIRLSNIDNNTWDETISAFDTCAIFHKSAWLNFIEKSQKGECLLLEIHEEDKTIGYFACFIIKKGPFKILGSPLVGWTTQYMGPIVNKDFRQAAFLEALDTFCLINKIDQLEISSPIFDPPLMYSSGFKCKKDVTPIVELNSDIESMWNRLEAKSCRYYIRKAQKNDIQIEETCDPDIIDEFYNQLKEVFTNKGLTPTYPRERVALLFECLMNEGMLFALRAKYEGKVIATALFPHDSTHVYYWGGASDQSYRKYNPNELMQWSLMTMAANKGITVYDMYSGDNQFKLKFGANLVDVFYWYKSYSLSAKLARYLYHIKFKCFQYIGGFARKHTKKYLKPNNITS